MEKGIAMILKLEYLERKISKNQNGVLCCVVPGQTIFDEIYYEVHFASNGKDEKQQRHIIEQTILKAYKKEKYKDVSEFIILLRWILKEIRCWRCDTDSFRSKGSI